MSANCCSEIQNNRYEAVESLQDRFGGVVLLKGSGTLVCSPDHEVKKRDSSGVRK